MNEPDSTTEPRIGEPGIPGEDTDRVAAAEIDAGYRWAAAGVAGRHVLVAGCNRGHGARTLLEAGAASVVGADPDERAVEAATRLHGDRIRFVQAETAALPFATGGFDAVVCIDARAAEPAPEAAIDELIRVLAPEGLLLVSVPLTLPRPDAAAANGSASGAQPPAEAIAARFANSARYRRRLAVAAAVAPVVEEERADPDASWLTAGEGEDRTILVAASDGELPELRAVASMVSLRDLRAQEETIAAWEQRARRAEAEGSAKHWELVAAREAQRRLRMHLHKLEHRPLRVISRVLRGKPARLGEGPPLRNSELKPERWD